MCRPRTGAGTGPCLADSLHIATLQSGGVIVNYRCPAACAHCLYACGPRREAGYLAPDAAARIFARIRALGCRSVHIGGGEPFLDPDGLAAVLDVAAQAGVGIEYVETNAAWFRDETSAVARLRGLHEHGLGTLLVSISPFHNAFIPFAKTRGLMRACRLAGMNVFPWRTEFAPEIEAFDLDRVHSMDDYAARHGADYLPRLGQRYGVTLGGRALRTFAPHLPRRPLLEVLEETRGGCRRLATTGHFHIDLFGGYVPGLCTGLTIAYDDLGAPLDPARYPLLTGLHGAGVASLFERVRCETGFTPRPDGYVNACELCLDLRSALVAGGCASAELGPRGFYEATRPRVHSEQ